MVVALVVATTCLLGMLHHDGPEHSCAFAATDSCPTFASITSRSLRVTWRPPSRASLVRRYELYTAETYASAGEGGSSPPTKVYSGLKRSVELKDLSPSTSYNFTVKIIGHQDSIRSSCWRFTRTLGEEHGNLLANPSFEEMGGPLTPQMDYGDQPFAAYWEPLMMPYSLKLLPKRGRTWYTHSNDAPNKRAAHQWVFLNHTEPTKMLLSGWSKASEVSGEPDDGYSVYMDLKFVDGTFAYGISLNFDTGTHDWQRRCAIVYLDKPLWSASVAVLFSEHTGSVWMDDIALTANFVESMEPECRKLHNVPSISLGCCPTRESILATDTPESDDVAIASQMTIDRLPVLESMAESWAGPISAVILLSNPEAELKQIHSLRNRSAVIRKNVDFHLVHGEENVYALHTLGLYPVNSLRNEAVVKSRTAHVMVLDIDFIPSRDARENILRLWDQLHEPQTVFVVASFEMDDFNMRDVPHTKDQLLRMVAQDRIRQVHKDKWFPAHGPTDYEHWYSTRELYQVPYQRDYEPYYIVRKDVPLWDERFVGYGFDKVSHSTELNAAGYSFFVMPDTFIIHAEHGVPGWRGKGDFVRVRVWFNYYSFLGEMMLRHSTEVQPHSHFYEGRDWAEEEGSVVMAGPVYATGLMASLVLFAYAVTRFARSRRTGRSL